MSVSTVEAFEKAAELGLKLGLKEPDKLTFEPVSRCPPEFIEVLKLHKQNLIALLRMPPFVMVRSRTLDNEILFFCADESTKTFLVLSGASQSSIYTKAELQPIEQNRVAPISG